jgi:uncharacterized protein (DUF58 family)
MKPSREGKRFFLATFLIAVAAFNTGNNLIYLILSMMLSIIVLSIAVLKFNMKGLVLKVSQSRPVFANSPSDIDIALTNNKKKAHSYSINVTMAQVKGAVYFPEISGSSYALRTASVLYNKRGVYGYGDFFIGSGFPFIFLTKKILCNISDKVIVYPEIKNIDEIAPELTDEVFALLRQDVIKGEEPAVIREFRYGDDRRKIHWKASAKTAKLMVMESAAEEPRKLTLMLDNMRPHAEYFEKAVSFAASLADKFLTKGFFVRLLTCKKVVPFGTGEEHLFKILDVLAVIKSEDLWECPSSTESGTEGLTVLILNSEDSPLGRFIHDSDMVIYASTI